MQNWNLKSKLEENDEITKIGETMSKKFLSCHDAPPGLVYGVHLAILAVFGSKQIMIMGFWDSYFCVIFRLSLPDINFRYTKQNRARRNQF